MSPTIIALQRKRDDAEAAIEAYREVCPHAEKDVVKTHEHRSTSGGEYVNERTWYWVTDRRCGWCGKWLGEVKGKQ